jgi:hypothetical protein
VDDLVCGRLGRLELKEESMNKIPNIQLTADQLAAMERSVQAYLVLTLVPVQIGNAGPTPMLMAKEIAVYSEPWPTSIHGEVRVVMREARGAYHLSGKALDDWAADYLPEALKPFYRPRSWK